MLICVVLTTSLALVANARVLRDCSAWLWAGLMVQIIAVLAFPPNECCKILVSLESLYGMCPLFLLPPLKSKMDNLGSEKIGTEKETSTLFLQ